MQFWRSWYFRIPASIALTVVISTASYLVIERLKAQRTLRDAVEQLDASDPDWRLDRIEANRRVLADADNGALVVIAAHRLLPAKWDMFAADEWEVVPPPMRPLPETIEKANAAVKSVAAALAESRRMVDYPAGRFAI